MRSSIFTIYKHTTYPPTYSSFSFLLKNTRVTWVLLTFTARVCSGFHSTIEFQHLI